MSNLNYRTMLESNLVILSYETNIRRAKKLRVYLSNITKKTLLCDANNFIEEYQKHSPDIILFSFNTSSDMLLLEKIVQINSKQIIAVLVQDATSQEYKKFITLKISKFIIQPYNSKTLLEEVISLAQSKILHQTSFKLSEQKEQQVIKIDKLKESLLTLFTHELKTPLNAILNFAKHSHKLVSKSDIANKEKLLYELKEIGSNSKVIAELVDNIINSMKIRTGNIKITMEEINIYNFFYAIKEKYIDEIGDYDVLLEIDTHLNILSDKKYLMQMFTNIYTNAIKYGKSKVIISATIQNSNFVISIEDDGIGMKFDEKMFELFEQSSADMLQRTDKGCGVGLYLVKEIVDIFGYNIDINSSSLLGGAKISISGKVNL